jgi:prephenate dehydratase
VRRVYSHPQALAQCERFCRGLGVETIGTYDTAGSVKMIREQQIRDGAAIASSRAATLYGMTILAAEIEDLRENYTRFVAIARDGSPLGAPTKSSIAFSLSNVPGSLFKALSVFALRDIDLLKIESRPLRGKRWQYLFYVDFAGNAADNAACQRALDHLREFADFVKVLGAYPRWREAGTLHRAPGTEHPAL